MDFDHISVRSVVNEDRLSSLPDELTQQILSSVETKYVVQTCLLSSRWKFLWKSMPCLSFYSQDFDTLPKFAKFVTNVLCHRNNQIEVSRVKLHFQGAASQVFVRKIANYAFSHNVQELTIISLPKKHSVFPPCLFSSGTLKHFTFSSPFSPCLTPKAPWDFPALMTLHLSEISLCDENTESLDLFSKCVNLRNLTLKNFTVIAEVFDIITPRLSNLVLISGSCYNAVNVIAPQLENLTINYCSINYLNAPPGISSFCYKDYQPAQLPKDCFHSLSKVTVTLDFSRPNKPYKEKDARETIDMLQELYSARFLTLNLDIVECLSSFPDLVSSHPSPFSNLISLSVDSSREEEYKVKISAVTRSFLLENSPSATFITDLPEEPLTKAMKAKQAREKKAKIIADIENHMTELQASLEQENMLFVERKQVQETKKAAVENLTAELLQIWAKKKMMQSELERSQIEVVMAGLKVQIVGHMKEMVALVRQECDNVVAIGSKKAHLRSLLENLSKRQRAALEARCSPQFEQTKTLCDRLSSAVEDATSYVNKMNATLEILVSHSISTSQDVSSSKLPPPSEPSSSSAIIPTASTSSINPMQ